ncbi:ATP-binding protein [Ekhidna sp. MALMAid0563]|uniref:sensor histidine kinase n=1 Tax=Ekhidna sp. MALMAid0563 TaxID=3143937 RepID=UPI0032DE3B2E
MEGKVILLVIIGTIGVMLMAFSVVFFVLLYRRKVLENKLEMQSVKTKHQEEMLSATLKSQEEERNRLGTELHDGVGAMLSSIKLNLQVVNKNNDLGQLKPALGHLDETITQVRNISHQMMPIILKKYGVKRAIEDLFEKTSNSSLNLSITQWEEPDLDGEHALMLYRIVQELVNNSLKHAEATFIELSIKKEGVKTIISYSDNGNGFPENVIKNSDGIGLLNVKNRAQTIGAKPIFYNHEKGGAKVDLVIDTLID